MLITEVRRAGNFMSYIANLTAVYNHMPHHPSPYVLSQEWCLLLCSQYLSLHHHAKQTKVNLSEEKRKGPALGVFQQQQHINAPTFQQHCTKGRSKPHSSSHSLPKEARGSSNRLIRYFVPLFALKLQKNLEKARKEKQHVRL